MSTAASPEPQIVGASERPVNLTGATETVPIAINARAHRETLATQGVEEPKRILLHLEDIEADENPGSVYGIYLNLPEDADRQQLAEHHVGNLSFFGLEQARRPSGDEAPHGIRSSVDITNTVESLKAHGQWDGRGLRVTLRPLGLHAPEGREAVAPAPTHEDVPVHVGRVSLSYA